MKDFLYLGSSPVDEECIQVIPETDYLPAQRRECERFKKLLEEKFEIPSDLASEVCFSLKREEHEFGPHYEVVVEFNENIEEAVNFAFNVETNLPPTWN